MKPTKAFTVKFLCRFSNNTQKRMLGFCFGWSGDGIGDTVDTQVEKLTTRVPLLLIQEYVISSSHHYISRFKLRFLSYFICSTFTPILSRVCFWASLCHFAWDFCCLIVNTCVNRHRVGLPRRFDFFSIFLSHYSQARIFSVCKLRYWNYQTLWREWTILRKISVFSVSCLIGVWNFQDISQLTKTYVCSLGLFNSTFASVRESKLDSKARFPIPSSSYL